VDSVVFGVTGADGAGESEVGVVEGKIFGRAIGIKPVGGGDRLAGESRYDRARIAIGVGRAGRFDAMKPVGAPLKGTDEAIGVTSCELALPVVDPPGV
jgi:hypothetical protein